MDADEEAEEEPTTQIKEEGSSAGADWDDMTLETPAESEPMNPELAELAEWFKVEESAPSTKPDESETESESDVDSDNNDVKVEEEPDDDWLQIPSEKGIEKAEVSYSGF